LLIIFSLNHGKNFHVRKLLPNKQGKGHHQLYSQANTVDFDCKIYSKRRVCKTTLFAHRNGANGSQRPLQTLNNGGILVNVGCAKRLYLRTVMAPMVRNLPLQTLHNGGILGCHSCFCRRYL
jgi:hypothetical protein